MLTKKLLIPVVAGILLATGTVSSAAVKDVTVGVLTDMSGPYADVVGPGSVEATGMAAADCMKAECKGMNVQVIYADNHNKNADGLAVGRNWIDQGSVNDRVDQTNTAIDLGWAGI